MNHDIDIKKLRINCFRQSKVAGEFMLQMRVPGSMIAAKYLQVVQDIAENWGNGTFHIGMRQTLNIPGIKYEYIGEVNKYIKDYIKEVEVEMCDVDMDVTDYGYPTIGARNVMSCIGNTHCIKANVNTYQLARKIEKIIFPSHYHIKVFSIGSPEMIVEKVILMILESWGSEDGVSSRKMYWLWCLCASLSTSCD